MRHRVGRAATAACLTVLVLSGCGEGGGRSSTPEASPINPGLGHVHGLGINPGEDAVYAASHYGLWRLPIVPGSVGSSEPLTLAGVAERIADRFQDTMGFVVAGRDSFYGSGHPDFNEQPDLRPPLLGLITSTNRGQTWTNVSLRAKADFHDLEVADSGRHVVGYDSTSQRVMVSRDSGRTWSAGSRIELRDLTIDPRNPTVVLGTTAGGLARSVDAGRTFGSISKAPPLLLVSWLADPAAGAGTLWGLDGSGTVWRTRGTALLTESWERVGSLTRAPEAFLAVKTAAGVRLIAADERGISSSSDGGRSWASLVLY